MNYLLRGLRAEYLKTHRTIVYWLLLLCPLALNILVVLIIHEEAGTGRIIRKGMNPWIAIYNINFSLLTGVFIILFVAIINSLLNNIEHKSNSWKHLYAIAQPRWAVYFHKSLFSIGALLFAMLVFSLMQPLSGMLLNAMHPDLKMGNYPMEFSHSIKLLTKAFISTLGIWSIHQWITFRYRNFALSVGIGIIALISVEIIGDFFDWMKYTPYALPGQNVGGDPRKVTSTTVFTQEVWLGLGWGMTIWLMGFWDAKRRDVV
ncbi:ABC transporter permease [Microscilla marina]|uniref:Membrane protein, putative n=1 Tax=Microscilla marina ATCC 23134 TaxID=313606 RepID=A1ZR54_MICM2|nr:ABC transporter permease [Microscilla marina]EAY27143.1 membrane protein, putative [Microscilla marina ATCC 23134]